MNNNDSNKGEIVMYQPDETIRLEVRMDEETVWLTQQQMAELFQKDQSVVARHINNAFKEGELDENSNMHFLHNTRYDSFSWIYSVTTSNIHLLISTPRNAITTAS